ncbi:hypothetical protein A2U01_0015447, partial [Trifolium medium]|nr:hypothetical protein [Trifolium medium]
VEFSGLFIINGLVANLMIYMIDHHLFWGTAIWWLFCLGIVAANIASKVLNKPPHAVKLPPQNTTPFHKTTII